ncbi:MAG: aldehyde dehydrogenase family protein, partial [Vicinamibacterales bacterium]
MADLKDTARLRSAELDERQVPRGDARLGRFCPLIAGEPIQTGHPFVVPSPYDGSAVASVDRAGPAEIERAIAAAVRAFEVTRRLPTWKRAAVLEGISAAIAARRDELAQTIALEAGKPVKTARVEVDRAVFTFKVAAEETKRIHGEIISLDWLPGTEGREGFVRRVPLGPVAGITPFN